MSLQYSFINYDPTLFKSKYSTQSYNRLITYIKNNKELSKIIYEKEPIEIKNTKRSHLLIDKNRHISDQNDSLILFSTLEPSEITTLWYKEYGTSKHISIYNGKAVVIDLYMFFYYDITIQENSSIFSSVFCDFKYFNIKNFIYKYQNKSFDLNSYYTVI